MNQNRSLSDANWADISHGILVRNAGEGNESGICSNLSALISMEHSQLDTSDHSGGQHPFQ